MKTKETIYETTTGSYQVKIWDIINKDWIYKGTVKGLENALSKLTKYQIEYYKDKIYLLPKCICIDFNRCVFSFAVYYNGKTIINKSCSTLESAILEKEKFLLKLLY